MVRRTDETWETFTHLNRRNKKSLVLKLIHTSKYIILCSLYTYIGGYICGQVLMRYFNLAGDSTRRPGRSAKPTRPTCIWYFYSPSTLSWDIADRFKYEWMSWRFHVLYSRRNRNIIIFYNNIPLTKLYFL